MGALSAQHLTSSPLTIHFHEVILPFDTYSFFLIYPREISISFAITDKESSYIPIALTLWPRLTTLDKPPPYSSAVTLLPPGSSAALQHTPSPPPAAPRHSPPLLRRPLISAASPATRLVFYTSMFEQSIDLCSACSRKEDNQARSARAAKIFEHTRASRAYPSAIELPSYPSMLVEPCAGKYPVSSTRGCQGCSKSLGDRCSRVPESRNPMHLWTVKDIQDGQRYLLLLFSCHL